MNSKYTLQTLCEEFDKIEVPIIQRDYAQGRESDDVVNIRQKFVNEFLIKSLLDNEPKELDFVYGSRVLDKKDGDEKSLFIPLDGQQRLTTLFLLHYYLGQKENKMHLLAPFLQKFTYETRPSAHDFCEQLIKFKKVEEIKNIKSEIINSAWFSWDWLRDSTISGMLNMLDAFAKNEDLNENKDNLVERLVNTDNPIFSFYFTDLDQFGLSENLYIRMNARGKMLTDFENFKSEFYKIISFDQVLLEDVKNKIEYDWVTNLWLYREADSFVIDKPFMNLLAFISFMLYRRDVDFNKDVMREKDFFNLDLMRSIYSKAENVKFLIFVLDKFNTIPQPEKNILWGKYTFPKLLQKATSDTLEITERFVLFSAFVHMYEKAKDENLHDYIRVVGNLVENTDDKSQREWKTILASLKNLIDDKNVYEVLMHDLQKNSLQGLYTEQRNEEIVKANIFHTFPDKKNDIFKYEDNPNFKGNIISLLKIPFVNSYIEFKNKVLQASEFSEPVFNTIDETYKVYLDLSYDHFNNIWGNLINGSLYYQTDYGRVDYNRSYAKHFAIINFAKEYSFVASSQSLSQFTTAIQKNFVQKMLSVYGDLSSVRKPKEQLFLYYIIHEQLAKKDYRSFFKNNNFNFGWLKRIPGYQSMFKKGISGDENFDDVNPIYQVYNEQFRYNLGINKNNTLDEEIIFLKKQKCSLDALKDWATN